MERLYDVVVIGGGPAGLSAGLYAARGMRKTLLIEKAVTGGQIALTERVENYPGFVEPVNGFDLAQNMQQQAELYGMETLYAEVSAIELGSDPKRITTSDGDILARSVIVTAGADPNKLEVPGETELTGKGVSYCATCDGAFFKDQDVAVVGGGDAALDEGLFLTRYASKVTIIHRRKELRASGILQERAFNNPKIEFIWDSVVESIDGQGEVQSVHLRNLLTGETSVLPVAACFIFIGLHPNSDFLRGALPMDAAGHVEVDLWMRTPIDGVLAAGDIRAQSARQVISAAGDGATAAIAAEHYLASHPAPEAVPVASAAAR
jgi:thioredoxin reductase (NADPH)